ncbi:MAG: DUF3054 domain-containing protein [Actinobacteria bacterium]|nr:DUF3054 domain-containing protein [Actinomycetota bacterium]MBV8395677.1 DUF3054 domain-containing protein [Actinomycetota bacterium]MBV8598795.1 DUF3054 domain-containing protein [Actinomycetota bacterium]
MRSLLSRALRLPHRVAVASDLVALALFVTVGLVNHHGGVSATGYARDLLPIGACWLVAGGAFDLYKHPRPRALLGTWLVAVVAGIAIRQLVLWRLDGNDAVFLVVALCFSLLFVLALRAATAAVVVRARCAR